jgi:hypothetical protein
MANNPRKVQVAAFSPAAETGRAARSPINFDSMLASPAQSLSMPFFRLKATRALFLPLGATNLL